MFLLSVNEINSFNGLHVPAIFKYNHYIESNPQSSGILKITKGPLENGNKC